MKARRLRNLPYIRCKVVLRKSLSLGSSLSKSSRSCCGISDQPSQRRTACNESAHLKYELGINVALGNVCVEVWTLDEAQKEFVDDLQVRPSELENRLVLFRVIRIARRIHRRRNSSE